jgi:hypothetical protein
MPRSALFSCTLPAAMAAFAVGCAYGSGPSEAGPSLHPVGATCPDVPACDAGITVAPDSPALILRDPEVLAELPLDRVLGRMLELGDDLDTTPEELIQRVFDSNNTTQSGAFADGIHCDSPDNRAHENAPAAFCPRTEGALAMTKGFFDPGAPDGFVPVAVVNRIDLMSGDQRCGEYRIVYAKVSGSGNPDDRVFLILEASLTNPVDGCLEACRPAARLWHEMETRTPAERAEAVRAFFFDGVSGFAPALVPQNLGLRDPGDISGPSYGESDGQLRVGQHMDEVWEYRQLQLRATDEGRLRFEPVTVSNNPLPSRFAPDPFGDHDNYAFQYYFPKDDTWNLSVNDLRRIGMTTNDFDEAGESTLAGAGLPDYASHLDTSSTFDHFITVTLQKSPAAQECPPDDPLDARAIARRASTQSCAGCHAPATVLGPERKIGCGLVWPDSLGQVHIDEKGELSPALKELFLPKRAEALGTFLQACDQDKINRNLRGGQIGPGTVVPSN